MFQKSYLNFIFSLLTILITAGFCSYFNRIGMENFYNSIQKSALTPPNIVFPIVWGVLYVLLVLAFDIILNSTSEHKKSAIGQFLFNMLLQIIWCWLFFNNGNFLLGFAVLIILDFATAIIIEQFYKINRSAGWLLLPYMLWLLFATYLNWVVLALNGNNFTLG